MSELDRFEARLAVSLARLADQVPTEVDPVRVAATIASSERRARVPWWPGLRSLRLVPTLQLAIVLAALLALALGLLVLAPRLLQSPFEAALHGRIVCEGAPWTTSDVGGQVLDCRSELADPRLAGTVRISVDELPQAGTGVVRPGAMELRAGGASWTGGLQVTTAANGLAIGDAVLEGDGTADGVVLHLHLLSTDGLAWGVLATTSEAKR
jgi:hypothetical protein